jgi:hypothetical protein
MGFPLPSPEIFLLSSENIALVELSMFLFRPDAMLRLYNITNAHFHMNKLLVLIVVVLLGAGAYWFYTQNMQDDGMMEDGEEMVDEGMVDSEMPVPGEEVDEMEVAEAGGESEGEVDGTREVVGTVTAVNTEMAALDGPFLVTLETEADGEATIVIPSMGILLCAAQDAIVAVDDIEVGATVEARGAVNEEGQIVPCESEEDYVRVVE